ncbi:MAG: molybdopterin-dependent oxidoreductase [Microthrixaceae bacterium]
MTEQLSDGDAGSIELDHQTSRDRGRLDDEVREIHDQLTVGEDVIEIGSWAGSIPQAYGTAPHVRVGRDRWFNLLWLIPMSLVALVLSVALGKALRDIPAVEAFITRHPGTIITPSAQEHAGFPVWLNAQHFLNLFLMTFIIRAGWQILADHPRLYWTRHSTPGKEWFRFQKPVHTDRMWTAKQDSITLPRHIGLPGIRHSIGLARWWHLGVDVLWLANGILFYILLFSTGQWRRIIPTTWEVFPNAISTMIQYMSLNWPAEHGWVAYNGLQLITYFITVFVAAPAALLSGLGMSPALSTRFRRVSMVLSIQVARSLHFLVMCWFLFFIVSHVTMVFTTGLVVNLNHMFAARDTKSWVGMAIFLIAMTAVTAAWFAASPFTLRHPRVVQRVGFALIGPFQRLFEHLDSSPGEYSDKDLSPYFWHNGRVPDSVEYQLLQREGFEDYRLVVDGLVESPVGLGLADLHALAHHEQTTQHFCIQGWSGVAKWGGVSMQTILDLVHPLPEAEWVVFYSFGEGSDGGLYYDAHPIDQMGYELTMLAYDMNGEPLSFGHGAPLRLRNEVQLGFKQVKWIKGIEFVHDLSEVGGGFGGYNEDHEFFGYRQSI